MNPVRQLKFVQDKECDCLDNHRDNCPAYRKSSEKVALQDENDFSCCGGNDDRPDSKDVANKSPKAHTMDCDMYPGLIPKEPAKDTE